jgi:hypothetical protein
MSYDDERKNSWQTLSRKKINSRIFIVHAGGIYSSNILLEHEQKVVEGVIVWRKHRKMYNLKKKKNL